jgi:hypothetical protein
MSHHPVAFPSRVAPERIVSINIMPCDPRLQPNPTSVIMTNLQQKIQEEREFANQVCDTKGGDSPECAAALDALEEVQAEAAHQKAKGDGKNSLERFCDLNPDADECRIYED